FTMLVRDRVRGALKASQIEEQVVGSPMPTVHVRSGWVYLADRSTVIPDLGDRVDVPEGRERHVAEARTPDPSP
ncbi:MAG: hypothetical protein ABW022_20090, partial [Actinoplanes sp.]